MLPISIPTRRQSRNSIPPLSSSPGDLIMKTVSETSKNSKRWQQFSSAISEYDKQQENEQDNNIISNKRPNSRQSFRLTENTVQSYSTPLIQTPSYLYIQYEQAIDKAMQQVRNLKSSLRDDTWEDHNGDQLVASLFALSRSCIETAELFVTKQEQKYHINNKNNDSDNENNDIIKYEDPFTEQLPTLNSVIKKFTKAKNLHENLKNEAKTKQKQMKYKYAIYLTPVLNPNTQKHDNKKLAAMDPQFTDYTSIEEFLKSSLQDISHPFGKSLSDYIEYFTSNYSCRFNDYTQKTVLNNTYMNLSQYIEALTEGIIRRYQYIDLDKWETEVSRSVNNIVIQSVYRSILPAYIYQEKDNKIDRKISILCKYKHQPELLGVPKRLCTAILDQLSTNQKEYVDINTAIQYIKELPCLPSVEDKLHHIVETINILCTSVEGFYYKHIKTTVTLSADDVLSLFVYAIISANVPCIYSQCRFIDKFISDESTLGEEGYALATFDTALSAINALDETMINENT